MSELLFAGRSSQGSGSFVPQVSSYDRDVDVHEGGRRPLSAANSSRRRLVGGKLMNDSPSQARKSESSPAPGESLPVRADGSSKSSQNLSRRVADEATIITGLPPIPAAAVSGAAARILDGRVAPGDRIGHFELVEYVGGGGMGRVFRAIDTRLGRTVALKVLSPDQAAGADALQRFQNEAQSAARLDHENIVRIHFVGEDSGLSYIAFEFVEGVNVRVLVERKGPLPLAESLSYTLQVAEALTHADARGVVHRDIKPSNMLIAPEGRVKLIDMGLARLRNGDPAAADLTQSGVTLGTFDYISPEQARDPRSADVRSDIYSLGCTLFFMLAGQPPFPEGTVLQKLLQHQGDQPPDVRELRPDLPEELSRVLRKMMAKDPRHRYATPVELMNDLLAVADQIGLRPMSPTSRVWLMPPDRSVSFFRRHVPWMAPVVALLGVVLLVDHLSDPRGDPSLPPLVDASANDPATKHAPDNAAAKNDPPQRESTRKKAAGQGKTKAVAKIDPPPALPQATPPSPATSVTDDDRPLPSFLQDPLSDLKMSPLDAAPPYVAALPADRRDDDNPKPKLPAASPPRRFGLLIVGDNAEAENEFASLAAACAHAHNGDIIELRFNGPRQERPIKLANLQVTVRPGDGYQPIVVFHPTEINPVKEPGSMFTLSAGRLTMADVAVEFYVPRDVPADNWTMLETRGGQSVRLERCSLTVRNASKQRTAYHQDVAFVRARPAPDADVATDSAATATPLATIELIDCIARGEAAFLRVEDLQPVYLLWDNGLLATSEQLLTASGGQAAPKSDEALRLELRHLTAAVRGGLCRLSATPANPYQLTVQFVCSNDIILTAPSTPLVEQEGTASIEKARQRFVWNGDRNFYQNVDVFWTVRNVDSQVAPDVTTFDRWKTYWGASRENLASREPLVWRKAADASQPLYAHATADYTLEDPTFGDASAGAPGFRADRLPPLPPESAPEPEQPSTTRTKGD